MASPLDIAVTGLTAQTRRVEASASNVANVRSRGAMPDATGAVPEGKPAAYQPVGVAQSEQRLGADAAGTRATFTPITPAYLAEYEPEADYADAQGMVAAPNVDLAREAVNQIAAGRAYAANIAVTRTADEMQKSLLDSKV